MTNDLQHAVGRAAEASPFVLVADDDDGFLETTCDILRQAGFRVTGVASAEAVQNHMRQEIPDVLITDIQMPGSDNLEYLGKLTQVARSVPVVVITGYPSVATAAKSFKLPVVAYLAKPLDIEAFLDEVRRAASLGRIHRSILRAHERAKLLEAELRSAGNLFDPSQGGNKPLAPIESVAALLFASAWSALSELEELVSASLQPNAVIRSDKGAFRPLALVEILQETVILLEKSKRDFKSKELAELRKRIERVLDLPGSSHS